MGGSLWLVIRGELRARRGTSVAVVAVVAVGTAVALGALAGAQRTSTALSRYAQQSRASDLAVIPGSPNRPHAPSFTVAQVASIAQVRAAYALPYMYFRAVTPAGRLITFADLHLHVSPDPRVGRTIDGLKVVAGAMADPRAANELMLSSADAHRLGLGVGSRLAVHFGSPTQQPGLSRAVNNPARSPASVPYTGPRVTLRVAGIYADLGTLAVDFGGSAPYRVALLTPAFQRVYGSRVAELSLIFASLTHGQRDLAAFQGALQRRDGGAAPTLQPLGAVRAQLQRRVEVYAVVLRLLAVLVAILGMVLAAQLLAARSTSGDGEFAALRALGMTRGQLVAIGVGRAAVLGVPAALSGALGAIALSPLTPLGAVARTADPRPGVSVNVVILALGAITAAVATGLVAVPAAWLWASRAGASPERPAPARIAVGPALPRRWRVPLTAWLAARIAPRSGGGGARVALARIGVGASAVALITVVLVSVASFGHLRASPRIYGQDWDVTVGGGGGGPITPAIDALTSNPAVAAVRLGSRAEATIDGHVVGLLGLGARGRDPEAVQPTVLSGRAPAGAKEILLGRHTSGTLGRTIGSEVSVSAGPRRQRMRVVGIGVIPNLNDALRLGDGALVTMVGLRALVPQAFDGYGFVRLRDPAPTALARFAAGFSAAAVPGLPPDVSDLGQAQGSMTPVVLLLAVLGAAALLQALNGMMLSGRHDLAVLKALGLEPGRLHALVTWQASAGGALVLLVGLPVGAFGGRWFWRLVADQLGVSPAPVVPALDLVVLAVVTMLAAVGLALVPGRAAARIPAAAVLRRE